MGYGNNIGNYSSPPPWVTLPLYRQLIRVKIVDNNIPVYSSERLFLHATWKHISSCDAQFHCADLPLNPFTGQFF